jgi:hypothetical protein
MPTFETLRIFISYARKDGGVLAHRLQSDLTKEGFDAWLDTQRLRSGSVWSVEIEHEIDKRQVTLALLSRGRIRLRSAVRNSFAPSTGEQTSYSGIGH